jgi:NADH-quinone oxidoreductase subunit A
MPATIPGRRLAALSPPDPDAIVRPSFGTIFTNGAIVLYEYGHLAILLVVAIIFPLGAVVTSWALQFVGIRPQVTEDPVKTDTYECGLRTEGPSLVQFNFRFYYIALLFLLFDVELMFLFPWAVVFDEVGTAGFLKVLLFLSTFVVGGLYAWRKGALEWR